MKGFPNQISNVQKLADGLRVLKELADAGQVADDSSFGEALLWAGVISPGRSGGDVRSYLSRMSRRAPSNQSHRTSARGVKEFFVRAGLAERTGDAFTVSELGNALVSSLVRSDNDGFIQNWKRAMMNAVAEDDQGVSHPYRIMLRLLKERPGTPRALCALALEARNDSESEFERILGLRDLDDEEAIRNSIGATQSNWNNAKKILPSIAEQIGDVAKSGDSLFYVGEQIAADHLAPNRHRREEPRWGRARPTSAESIAAWRGSDESDEGVPLVWVSTSHGVQLRAERTERHNGIVRAFARGVVGATAFWEDPIDCLAQVGGVALLAEVKTLDGSPSDERRQVRTAAGQLLYYEFFSMPEELTGEDFAVEKLAVFESQPSAEHVDWLISLGIAPIWMIGGAFSTRPDVAARLKDYVEFVDS